MMWRTVKLGDIAKPYGGNGFPKKYQGSADGDIPFLKVSDMNSDGNEKFMIHANNYVTSSVLREIKAKIHPTGTIIFPKIGGAISTNKKRILANPSAFDNNVMGVVPSEDVLPEYLLKIFHNLDLYELSNKAALPSITSGAVKDIDIPLPSLPVQKQIVEKLDAAFADIDKAISATEKNIENAETLFKRSLKMIFSHRLNDLAEQSLENVCEFTRGAFGGSLKKSIFVEEGYAVYEQRHAIYDQFDEIRYFITEEKFNEMQRFEVLPNDLIMSCSGTLGKIAIAPKKLKKGIINQALLKLTPKQGTSSKYLKYYLSSDYFQDHLKAISGGAAVKNVPSVKILKKSPVIMPELELQERLVLEIENIKNKTTNLNKLYLKKLQNLVSLKTAILNQAFSGELTKDAA